MASKLITVFAVFLLAFHGCLGDPCQGTQPVNPPSTCPSGDITRIPPQHIYTKLKNNKRPLVIGHRGNVQVAQENSLDSIKAVKADGADGFEVDVFMTADYQLVCFHDQNTMRLTGVNYDIEDIPGAIVDGLEYQQTIQYGAQQKTYSQKRSIAYLDEVLEWAKNEKLLVYIEMKPEPASNILARIAQLPRSAAMGNLVANKVATHNMLQQVVVSSFDVVKTASAKQAQNNLVIGTVWTPIYWNPLFAPLVVADLSQTTGLASCINQLAGMGKSAIQIVDFLFESGIVEKHIHASFTDLDFTMFGNIAFGGTTNKMCMFEKNYGKHIVVGAYTTHDLSKTPAQISSEIPVYQSLISDRVHWFFTDNIHAMKQLIKSNGGGQIGKDTASRDVYDAVGSRHSHNWRRSYQRSRKYF